jgi:hypothetical protein
MSAGHKQANAIMKVHVAARLAAEIVAYDGSAQAAKQILRGLAAARSLELELGAFGDALAERHRKLGFSA